MKSKTNVITHLKYVGNTRASGFIHGHTYKIITSMSHLENDDAITIVGSDGDITLTIFNEDWQIVTLKEEKQVRKIEDFKNCTHVKCVKWCGTMFTAGKIYKIISLLDNRIILQSNKDVEELSDILNYDFEPVMAPEAGKFIKRIGCTGSLFTKDKWYKITKSVRDGIYVIADNNIEAVVARMFLSSSTWDMSNIRDAPELHFVGYIPRGLMPTGSTDVSNNEVMEKIAKQMFPESKKLQEITKDNIVKVLLFNGFTGSYREAYDCIMINNSICNFGSVMLNNNTGWLEIIEKFTGKLNPLPVEESFSDWFEKNKLEGFSISWEYEYGFIVAKNLFKGISLPPGQENPEERFSINKSWTLQEQKHKCLQLMNIYKSNK